ncbi:putative protein LSM12 [Blattamonas nauphoetae]|uniref:LSM domain-containing protein n=1 Tax=Blattamonas nauphoetae TaxID=2049346 RepID=A0ABQ9YFH5_9EUKA|nr:putative protein LSM12 [Blattamonas nauphoetae]
MADVSSTLQRITLGSIVLLETVWGETIEGHLYAFDISKQQLVIEKENRETPHRTPNFQVMYQQDKMGDHTLRILAFKAIKSLTTKAPFESLTEKQQMRIARELQYVQTDQPIDSLRKRENAFCKQVTKNQQLLGAQVTPEVQTLFNSLHSMYPDIIWKDESMFIPKCNVYVHPPYGPNNFETLISLSRRSVPSSMSVVKQAIASSSISTILPMEFIEQSVGKKVHILMRNEKELIGTLCGFDDQFNLVVDEAIEYDRLSNGEMRATAANHILLNGTNIVMFCQHTEDSIASPS